MEQARTKSDEQVGVGPVRRRQFTPAFKAEVVEQCRHASVSGVALAHNINPVTVHRWIREAGDRRRAAADAGRPAFIAVAIPPTLPVPERPACGEIRIELRRDTTTVSVTWPLTAAQDCAAWLRELLR